MKPRNQKILVAAILLAAVAFGIFALTAIRAAHRIFWAGAAQTPAEFKTETPHIQFFVELLPPEATDIHYHIDAHGLYYASFHVTEQEFLNWAAQIESTSIAKDAKGQIIKKLRRVTYRYRVRCPYPEPERDQHDEVTFTTGYYTETHPTTTLKHIDVAYDSEKQRAYFGAKRR